MLKSRDAQLIRPPSLDPAEMPFVPSMMRLFAPLIEVEVESDCDVKDNHICRHLPFTVLKFLRETLKFCAAGWLKAGNPYRWPRNQPQVMADACLLYLSQERYSQLLVSKPAGNRRQWFDVKNDPVAKHHFLSYSAKYWDKHFDLIRRDAEKSPGEKFKEFKGSEESGDLQGRVGGLIESYSLVKEFLDSPNFQTCIQVQSLFVDAQFETFQGEHGALLKRVFPDWFLGANPIYKTITSTFGMSGGCCSTA